MIDIPASKLFPHQGPDMDQVEAAAIEDFLEDGELIDIAEHWAHGRYSDEELLEQFRKLRDSHIERKEQEAENPEKSEDDYASEAG